MAPVPSLTVIRSPPIPPGGVRRSIARVCLPSLAGPASGEAARHEYGVAVAAASPAVAGDVHRGRSCGSGQGTISGW
ncbi:hypothetical protein Misp03_53990 [Microbispora sp. NBRC 16548]|nr:hypothetical protein Misp03_53990 [Microbispora sp. NBRC 16548]